MKLYFSFISSSVNEPNPLKLTQCSISSKHCIVCMGLCCVFTSLSTPLKPHTQLGWDIPGTLSSLCLWLWAPQSHGRNEHLRVVLGSSYPRAHVGMQCVTSHRHLQWPRGKQESLAQIYCHLNPFPEPFPVPQRGLCDAMHTETKSPVQSYLLSLPWGMQKIHFSPSIS